jgi:hypothetical protein
VGLVDQRSAQLKPICHRSARVLLATSEIDRIGERKRFLAFKFVVPTLSLGERGVMDGLNGEPADCLSSSSPDICNSLLVLRSIY